MHDQKLLCQAKVKYHSQMCSQSLCISVLMEVQETEDLGSSLTSHSPHSVRVIK